MAKRREPRDCGPVLRFSGEADFVKAAAEPPHSKVTCIVCDSLMFTQHLLPDVLLLTDASVGRME